MWNWLWGFWTGAAVDIETPSARTLVVPMESRTLVISAESRTLEAS